jgi:hypothetical protein
MNSLLGLLIACGWIGQLGGCGSSAPAKTGSGGGGGTTVGGTGGRGGTTGAGGTTAGQLGPTARVRVVQLVKGVTFDAWGADSNYNPVRVGQNIAYETISAYLDVPLDRLTMDPTFVLLPSGEAPAANASWQVPPAAGDRTRIELTGLGATNNQATVILTGTDNGTNIAAEMLAESKLAAGSATKANLHISYNIFDLGGSVVPALAVVGQACFLTASAGVADRFSVDPGSFTVGLFDLEDVSDCTTTTPLATVALDVAAGASELVAMYHEAAVVKFVHAPIVVTP